jgi:Peroxidase, family 2
MFLIRMTARHQRAFPGMGLIFSPHMRGCSSPQTPSNSATAPDTYNMGLFNLSAIYIFLWDTLLVFANLVLPERPAGLMVHGQPVLGGKWPEYTPSQEQDSRCSCPALNALANHGEPSRKLQKCTLVAYQPYGPGIIPHNGRNISFVDLAHHVRATYNVSPTFCILILKFVARYTKKDYYNDTFELRELDAHNEIEHDGSLVRT